MWDLVVLVPDHCIRFTFIFLNTCSLISNATNNLPKKLGYDSALHFSFM